MDHHTLRLRLALPGVHPLKGINLHRIVGAAHLAALQYTNAFGCRSQDIDGPNAQVA